jgi:metal-responsive CopG/Arc/MetJ family transcriptional regulator
MGYIECMADGKRYVNVLFDERILKDIDDFRFKHRFPSRTEAIRWLIARSLKRKPMLAPKDGIKEC